MALRDQPYIPLYVQDFMTDEKLNECSAESTGVYIRIMCVMHKSQEYGTILLKQKDKQSGSMIRNFACKLQRQMPYQVDVIERSLAELVEEEVLTIDGDVLMQKRMVKDGKLSETRASAGSKGGNATMSRLVDDTFAQTKLQANGQAKTQASAEYEIENESIGTKKTKKPTVTGFETFWSAYPRKVAKPNALRAFEKIQPDDALLGKMLTAIDQAKASPQWMKDNGQFIPHPATWLNAHRWEDEVQTTQPAERRIRVLSD